MYGQADLPMMGVGTPPPMTPIPQQKGGGWLSDILGALGRSLKEIFEVPGEVAGGVGALPGYLSRYAEYKIREKQLELEKKRQQMELERMRAMAAMAPGARAPAAPAPRRGLLGLGSGMMPLLLIGALLLLRK